ncbi:hypothetical protein CPB85DRAFT_1341820 [Mucidula mucida]|nr:hypothetical protein CPB85DRAFT_1341820 [Mucidula mucida]
MSTLNRCATPSLLGMPNEILSDIIQLVPGLSALPVAKTLLRLCAVCRDLQTLVKEMPSLWSTIQIDARTPNYRIRLTDTNAELVFPTLNLALSLSRSKPSTSNQKAVNKFSIELCEGLMSLLLRHSHRIRSFRIKGTCWTHHLVVTEALAECRNLPNLRRWKQECVRSRAPFLSSSLTDRSTFPALEVVSISSSVTPGQGSSAPGHRTPPQNIPGLDRPSIVVYRDPHGCEDTLQILELSTSPDPHVRSRSCLGEPLVLSSLATFQLATQRAKELPRSFLYRYAEPPDFSLTAHCEPAPGRRHQGMLLTIMAVIRLIKSICVIREDPFQDFAPTPPLSLEQWQWGSKIPECDLPLRSIPAASRQYAEYPGAIPPRKP